MTEDEMVGWHHQLNGHEFEQAPGDGERQVLQSMGSQGVRLNNHHHHISIPPVFPNGWTIFTSPPTLSITVLLGHDFIFTSWVKDGNSLYSLFPLGFP